MTSDTPLPRSRAFLGLLGLLGVTCTAACAGPTNFFGFSGPEIFPIDPIISQLRSADFDRDGKQDLIVANNSRSKLTILYNRTGDAKRPDRPAESRRNVNELPPDARFRMDSIASEKRITSLVVGDLNADGRPDIAYYGEPKELIVQYNKGSDGWSAPKRWPIDDGLLDPNALTLGDLNGDRLPDLALLSDGQIYVLSQKEGLGLAEPERIPHTGAVKAIQVLDIDGNGRDDLLLVNWDSSNPFRFRLQNEAGQLGPEIHFTLPSLRSYLAEDLNQDHRMEVVTVAQKSGRATVGTFQRRAADGPSSQAGLGQFEVLALNKSAKNRRGMTWGDVNGDELPDLLVAEPDSGQLTVFLQLASGSLGAARTFPTLTGVSELAVADWDGDGRAEIFLLSLDERQIGVTSFDANGRLAFPTSVQVAGRPLALAAGPMKPGAKPSLLAIVEQESGRSLQWRQADGTTGTQKLSDSFKSNPAGLAILDANQDGLMDVVVLVPYDKLKVLVQVSDKPFEEADVASPGGNAELPWISSADVDGDGRPELLLAQKNFLRAVVLQADARGGKAAWSFSVKEQINGAGGNSRIVAAAALRQRGAKIPSVFLLDAERKALTLCERDVAGVWQVVRNQPLPVAEFTALQPLSLGDKSANAIAFLSSSMAGWMPLRGEVWEFTELDGFETAVKDGYLNDVVAGDLNSDGRLDLAFLETGKNHVELAMLDAASKLIPCNRWQVFEERTFRNRRSETPEPREALVGDFTGDNKGDLVLLVHDRLLLYPQE
jgi:hypothetical protein